MARKLVVILALMAAVGFSFGWIPEDLCCVGGSFADDPGTPVTAAEFALPAHSQPAPRAAMPVIRVDDTGAANLRLGTAGMVPQDLPAGLASLQNPRRC